MLTATASHGRALRKFGQLQHEGTAMVEWRKQPRHYAVLHDLDTRPRTIYLAKITNPTPRLP